MKQKKWVKRTYRITEDNDKHVKRRKKSFRGSGDEFVRTLISKDKEIENYKKNQ